MNCYIAISSTIVALLLLALVAPSFGGWDRDSSVSRRRHHHRRSSDTYSDDTRSLTRSSKSSESKPCKAKTTTKKPCRTTTKKCRTTTKKPCRTTTKKQCRPTTKKQCRTTTKKPCRTTTKKQCRTTTTTKKPCRTTTKKCRTTTKKPCRTTTKKQCRPTTTKKRCTTPKPTCRTTTTRRPHRCKTTTKRPHRCRTTTTKRPHKCRTTTKRPHRCRTTTKKRCQPKTTTKRPHRCGKTTKKSCRTTKSCRKTTTTEPTTEAITEPTTEATTLADVTEPPVTTTRKCTKRRRTTTTTEPTTEATTEPTTEGATQPTTEATTQPTTEATTEATTQPPAPGATQPTTTEAPTTTEELVEDDESTGTALANPKTLAKRTLHETDQETMDKFHGWCIQYARECTPGTLAYELLLHSFLENYELVKKAQEMYERGEISFQVSLNAFADKTAAQRMALSNKLVNADVANFQTAPDLPATVLTYERQYSWNQTYPQCVTPVKNQGQCSGCHCFGTVMGIEAYYCMQTGERVVFSEQQCLDCTMQDPYNLKGCTSGKTYVGFQYYGNFQYACEASSYPFRQESKTHKCIEHSCAKYRHLDMEDPYYYKLRPFDTKQMQQYIKNKGPLICEFSVSDLFNYYTTGVYSGEAACTPEKRNHVMMVQGWGTENGKDYWLVKNAWSDLWGNKGYGRIERGKNICGIEASCRIPKFTESGSKESTSE